MLASRWLFAALPKEVVTARRGSPGIFARLSSSRPILRIRFPSIAYRRCKALSHLLEIAVEHLDYGILAVHVSLVVLRQNLDVLAKAFHLRTRG